MNDNQSSAVQIPVPDPVNKDMVPPELHFDYAAFFKLERRQVERFLADSANDAVRNRSTPPSEQELGEVCEKTILHLRNFYTVPKMVDQRLYGAVLQNKLEEQAPSRATIRAYRIVMLVAVLLEVVIGVLLWALGQGSFAPVLLAALLAFGGFTAGNGVGGLLCRSIEFLDWGIRPDKRLPVMDVIKVVFGAGLTGGLSYARAAAADDPDAVVMVVLISLGLALVVAIFEALHLFTKEKYRKLRDKEADGQNIFAREEHAKSLDEYRRIFLTDVKRILRESVPNRSAFGVAS